MKGPRGLFFGPTWAPAILLSALGLAFAQSWRAPALEDDRFWWIPQAHRAAEVGPVWIPAGPLPASLWSRPSGQLGPDALTSPLPPVPPSVPPASVLPPQWQNGLPDYGHPPLFFWYLGAWISCLGPGMATVHGALATLMAAALLGGVQLFRTLLALAGHRDGVESTSGGLPGISDWSGLWWMAGGMAFVLASPVVAQLARADLDLGLLAVVPWALQAAITRRFFRFALLGALATAVKEPGILLAPVVLPFILQGPIAQRITALAAGLAPALSLGLWALVHRSLTGTGLASPEHLPANGTEAVLGILAVGRFVLLEQGRWLLLPLACLPLARALGGEGGPLRLRRTRHRGASASSKADGPPEELSENGRWSRWLPSIPRSLRLACLSLGLYLLVQIGFFGVVSFLAADPNRSGGAHWRYVLPAFVPFLALAVLGAASVESLWRQLPLNRWSLHLAKGRRLPILLSGLWSFSILMGVLDWHGPPVLGVERNLYALDLARAHGQLRELLLTPEFRTRTVWAGTYAWAELCVPALAEVGVVPLPCQAEPGGAGLRWYGQSTRPEALAPGELLIVSSHGEPLGRLAHTLTFTRLQQFEVGSAKATLMEVQKNKAE